MSWNMVWNSPVNLSMDEAKHRYRPLSSGVTSWKCSVLPLDRRCMSYVCTSPVRRMTVSFSSLPGSTRSHTMFWNRTRAIFTRSTRWLGTVTISYDQMSGPNPPRLGSSVIHPSFGSSVYVSQSRFSNLLTRPNKNHVF